MPWLLDSSELIYGRRSRPIPGQDRRGEPIRPVLRKALQTKPGVAEAQGTARLSGAKQSAKAKRTAEKLAADKRAAQKASERNAIGTTKSPTK